MLHYQGKSIAEYWRLKKIAKQVRAGVPPQGVSSDRILEAMKLTKPKHLVEVLGLTYAQVFHPDGKLKKDYGLVSVKSVTSVFVKHIVDVMCSSGQILNNFWCHKMGAGSTAESSAHTALVTGQDGCQTAPAAGTHGATSNIYRTIGTLTAGSAYGCREHGVFNASTGGIMLDRSVVTNIDLNAEDIVTWTYELTVNAGG